MFDGVYFIQNVPGFELLHGPLLALWTPVDTHGKFFALTGGEVVNYLLSLHQPHLDGFGPTPDAAEADLFAKINKEYDNSPVLQSLLRRVDGADGLLQLRQNI
jgi:hypothetical protein